MGDGFPNPEFVERFTALLKRRAAAREFVARTKRQWIVSRLRREHRLSWEDWQVELEKAFMRRWADEEPV